MRNKKHNHRQRDKTNDAQQYTVEEKVGFFVHYREENCSDQIETTSHLLNHVCLQEQKE